VPSPEVAGFEGADDREQAVGRCSSVVETAASLASVRLRRRRDRFRGVDSVESERSSREAGERPMEFDD